MKAIAFFLPQYHPIPENDEWWGVGFTEWRNVVKAKPRFKGHHQPQLPADLGFYDLRTPETRTRQADLAREYGIDAFCFHHYWFSGRKVLEKPIENILKQEDYDFSFIMNWANENWSRIWDGSASKLLLEQKYSDNDHEEHFHYLLEFFKDKRYLKKDGRPIFLVYRPDFLPNIRQFVDLWQHLSARNGFSNGLYLVAVNGSGVPDSTEADWISAGFDAVCDFQPRSRALPTLKGKNKFYQAAKSYLPQKVYDFLKANITANKIIDYTSFVENYKCIDWPEDYKKFPCVFPSWDNTARRKTAIIIQNTSRESFEEFLWAAAQKHTGDGQLPEFIFINAWNEWAEGCHLEPDELVGRKFLEAVRNWKQTLLTDG